MLAYVRKFTYLSAAKKTQEYTLSANLRYFKNREEKNGDVKDYEKTNNIHNILHFQDISPQHLKSSHSLIQMLIKS